ncbi:hypothetical protein [Luteimonas terrae]|uniref:hypothetical protein n=1 Tax=Luteimonas terrae TaxID=1530191 RepID=UPI000AA48265|nr:hypothetical protein [Luteimonas terrae]
MSDWWHWLLAIALCAAAIVLAFRSARNAPLDHEPRADDAAPAPDSRTDETKTRP